MFKVAWTEKSLKDLDKLENLTSRRIIKGVDELINNPCNKDIKKLKGADLYRLRVGDYRVIFEVYMAEIKILKVGHRRNVYG